MFGDTFAAAVARALDISIYDTQKRADTLLVTSGERDSKFQSDAVLAIGGRQWLLAASSRAADTSPLPAEAQRVLMTGLLLSLLLFALLFYQPRDAAGRGADPSHGLERRRAGSQSQGGRSLSHALGESASLSRWRVERVALCAGP